MEGMANENGPSPMDAMGGDAQVPYGDAVKGHDDDAAAGAGMTPRQPEYGAYANPGMSDDERYPFGKPEEPAANAAAQPGQPGQYPQAPYPGVQYPDGQQQGAPYGGPYGQQPGGYYGQPDPYGTNRQRYQSYERRTGTPEGNGYDGMCIAGFVMSLIIPLFGLIFSIIGLVNVRRTGKRGRGFAIAGIIISALSMLMSFLMLSTGMLQHMMNILM
ncbi:beta-galactosidase [Bifidobacterium castoris]|uniref:Beta-galactosidase n=2 Tax=Bifidobacterium castoris TaxID=2306972 RepID=A0A430F6Q7_9BIFI|nr:beta-galactosidase [Bifidobacterium castoris]